MESPPDDEEDSNHHNDEAEDCGNAAAKELPAEEKSGTKPRG